MNYLIALLVLSPFTAFVPALYFIKQIKDKKIKIEFNYMNLGLLSLFIWSFIVGVLNKDLLSTLGSIMFLFLFFTSVGVVKIAEDKLTLNYAIKILISFTTIAAVIGILEKIFFAIKGDIGRRIFSTFGNPNMTGSWFATIIFFIIYMMFTAEKKENKKMYIPSLLLIFIALMCTGSRGALVALVGTSGLILSLVNALKDKKTMTLFLILTATIILIVFVDGSLISKYIIAHPVQDSFSPRFKIWKGAITMIESKPIIGWGLLATFTKGAELLPLYNMNAIHVHNLWLTLLSTTGLIGFSIYLIIKIKLYIDIFKLYYIDKKLSLLFLAINSIVIIQGIVDVSLFAPQLAVIFVSVGAIANRLVLKYEHTYGKIIDFNFRKTLDI